MIRRHKDITGDALHSLYGSFDCETEGLYGEARLICLLLSDGTYKEFEGEKCSEEFIKEITGRYYRGYHLYAHNLTFDLEKTFGKVFGNSLDNTKFKLITAGTRLIKATYSLSTKNKLTLLDSYNLIPKKLSDIGEDLGFKKFKTPNKWKTGEKVREITVEDKIYCKRDCQIVLKILDLYKEMIEPFNIRIKVTEAANAKACWKSLYVRDKPIFLDEVKDERFRESYYGGRVEVFIRRHERLKLFYYDINSLYPSVMVNNKFPNPDKLRYTKDLDKALRENEGCAKITVKTPKYHNEDKITDPIPGSLMEDYHNEDKITDPIPGSLMEDYHNKEKLNYPVLPHRTTRLIFPVGTLTGIWNFPEIRLAISKGYEILETFWVLSSKPMDSPFNDYIKYFMDKKIQYQREGKAALVFLAKRMMNSLYGKFAQRIDSEDRYTHTEPDVGIPFKKLGKNTYKLHSVNKERAQETIVCWASYITSYARCTLYSYFPYSKGLYYCDTDSVVVEKPLSPEVIHNTEFGLMKLEDNIIESFFVAPKRYAYINDKEKTIKKIKGIPKDTVQMLPIESFGCHLGLFYSKPVKLKTALHKHIESYSMEVVKKNMSISDDKRTFSVDGNSSPIMITPINTERFK